LDFFVYSRDAADTSELRDDQELLVVALVVYDALYTWCRSLSGERHGWHPQAVLKEMRT